MIYGLVDPKPIFAFENGIYEDNGKNPSTNNVCIHLYPNVLLMQVQYNQLCPVYYAGLYNTYKYW